MKRRVSLRGHGDPDRLSEQDGPPHRRLNGARNWAPSRELMRVFARLSTTLLVAILLTIGVIAACPLVLAPAQGQQTDASAKKDGGRAANASAKTDASGAPGAGAISLGAETDYRINPNDVIEVRVEKAEELSGTFRISSAGTFDLPFLGRIVAKGKTNDELARQIADGLRGGYLVNPQVRVVITQYSGRSYFIQGAVRSPGLYQIGGYPSLLELITIAGGLAENHGATAFVIRKAKASESAAAETNAPGDTAQGAMMETPVVPRYDLLKVNINGLLRGVFEHNIIVEAGDIINIPVTDVFFIAGEVHAPGSFPLNEGTTLRQAVSLAQGTTFKAALSRAVIFREEPGTGKRVEIKVHIGEVMSGKKEDIPLLANDVVIVPNSRIKSVSSVLLSGFGFGATRILPVPIRRY